MAYHAGAELANLECFQINPLIKDYNGPACAYVTGPFGGYTANAQGRALHRVRLLERPDDAGVLQRTRRAATARCSSSSTTWPRKPSPSIEHILHTNERPEPRPLPRRPRHRLPQAAWSRCTSRRSASAAATAPRASGSTSTAETTVPGLYAAGDMRQRAAQLHARRLRLRQVLPARTRPTTCAGHRAAERRRRRRSTREGARARAARPRPTASRRSRSSTSCAASSTTTCSRPRSPARWRSACSASPRSAKTSTT